MTDALARTAAEALRTLHEAGRVRSPWLPGMRVVRPDGCLPIRLLESNAWAHEELVRQTDPLTVQAALRCSPDDVPDLDDPLTVQGLVLLAREAWASLGCTLKISPPLVTVPDEPWGGAVFDAVGNARRGWYRGPSEASIAVAALVAAAEGVRHG